MRADDDDADDRKQERERADGREHRVAVSPVRHLDELFGRLAVRADPRIDCAAKLHLRLFVDMKGVSRRC